MRQGGAVPAPGARGSLGGGEFTTKFDLAHSYARVETKLIAQPIPPRLHPPQQPIPRHRLHRTPQVLGNVEQLARLRRAEAFGILLEQRYNTPAHVAAGRTHHYWSARSWQRRRRSAGHVEQALTLLL